MTEGKKRALLHAHSDGCVHESMSSMVAQDNVCIAFGGDCSDSDETSFVIEEKSRGSNQSVMDYSHVTVEEGTVRPLGSRSASAEIQNHGSRVPRSPFCPIRLSTHENGTMKDRVRRRGQSEYCVRSKEDEEEEELLGLILANLRLNGGPGRQGKHVGGTRHESGVTDKFSGCPCIKSSTLGESTASDRPLCADIDSNCRTSQFAGNCSSIGNSLGTVSAADFQMKGIRDEHGGLVLTPAENKGDSGWSEGPYSLKRVLTPGRSGAGDCTPSGKLPVKVTSMSPSSVEQIPEELHEKKKADIEGGEEHDAIEAERELRCSAAADPLQSPGELEQAFYNIPQFVRGGGNRRIMRQHILVEVLQRLRARMRSRSYDHVKLGASCRGPLVPAEQISKRRRSDHC